MHAVVVNRSQLGLKANEPTSRLQRELHFTIYIDNVYNPIPLLFKYIQHKSIRIHPSSTSATKGTWSIMARRTPSQGQRTRHSQRPSTQVAPDKRSFAGKCTLERVGLVSPAPLQHSQLSARAINTYIPGTYQGLPRSFPSQGCYEIPGRQFSLSRQRH